MIIVNGFSQLGDELSVVSEGTLNAVTRYRKEDRDAVGKFHDTGEM